MIHPVEKFGNILSQQITNSSLQAYDLCFVPVGHSHSAGGRPHPAPESSVWIATNALLSLVLACDQPNQWDAYLKRRESPKVGPYYRAYDDLGPSMGTNLICMPFKWNTAEHGHDSGGVLRENLSHLSNLEAYISRRSGNLVVFGRHLFGQFARGNQAQYSWRRGNLGWQPRPPRHRQCRRPHR